MFGQKFHYQIQIGTGIALDPVPGGQKKEADAYPHLHEVTSDHKPVSAVVAPARHHSYPGPFKVKVVGKHL